MKNKHLVVLIIILSIVAIISSPSNKRTVFSNDETNAISLVQEPVNIKKEVMVKIMNNDHIEELELENYVIGVVAGEMPASFEIEALKAQAIAARTYAIKKLESSDFLYPDTRNQVYITMDDMKNKWQNNFDFYYNKVKEAVIATKGLIMKYNDEVISSFYFAMSNGKTENSEYVFSEKKDYLVSVDSSFEENIKGFIAKKEFSKDEFMKLLGIEGNSIVVGDVDRTPSNRINTIVINGKLFTGKEIRTLLNLRSTDFVIEINDKVVITTKGYGHGVGLSQYGANELAKTGKEYNEILQYYYQKIDITQINV